MYWGKEPEKKNVCEEENRSGFTMIPFYMAGLVAGGGGGGGGGKVSRIMRQHLAPSVYLLLGWPDWSPSV